MPEPEPELENVDPQPNSPSRISQGEVSKSPKVVSWQDGVEGKTLFTVGFHVY
jgi:hypothetical protein